MVQSECKDSLGNIRITVKSKMCAGHIEHSLRLAQGAWGSSFHTQCHKYKHLAIRDTTVGDVLVFEDSTGLLKLLLDYKWLQYCTRGRTS